MAQINVSNNLLIELSSPMEKAVFNRFWIQLHSEMFPGERFYGPLAPSLDQRWYRNGNSNAVLPFGLLGRLIETFHTRGIACEVVDRRLGQRTSYRRTPVLRQYQIAAANQLVESGGGILVAPPGSGKTVMALYAIASLQQTALWITHSRELAYQAMQKVCFFLGGKSFAETDRRHTVYRNEDFVIATADSLRVLLRPSDFTGVLVVDECHKIDFLNYTKGGSELLSFIGQCPSVYRFGLTARLSNPSACHLLGRVAAEIALPRLQGTQGVVLPKYVPVLTEHESRADTFNRAISNIVEDQKRLDVLVNLAVSLAREGRSVLILSAHVRYCHAIHQALLTRIDSDVGIVTGNRTNDSVERNTTLDRFVKNKLRVLVGGKALFEGVDLPLVDSVILALPTKDPSDSMQQIGRAMRSHPSKKTAVIYDIVDPAPRNIANLARRRKAIICSALDWQD